MIVMLMSDGSGYEICVCASGAIYLRSSFLDERLVDKKQEGVVFYILDKQLLDAKLI